jgi:pilus assembly protein FimV
MIITCKKCSANFNLDESLLKPTGSKVRCSKCKEIFTAYPPKISEETEVPVEMELDVEDQKVTEDLEVDKKETVEPDELDFSDMDKLIDEEEPEEPSEDKSDKATEDLDLDFDLDIEPETEKVKEDLEAKADQEEPDELDLSDLENLLDEEEVASEITVDETVEDLDLKIEPETDVPMEKVPPGVGAEELDELDLSDLEEILDLDEPTAEEESVPDDIVLELDMESEPELEKAADVGEAEDIEEVDLSEIEKMLEVEEETEDTEEPIEKELELELEVEEAPADTTLPEDSSQVEVYELDEAEDPADEPEVVEAAATEEREPEFEVGESEEEDQIEEEVAEEEPMLEKAAPLPKKRVSKPLVVLLILVMLAGGSYGTYVLLDYMNIEIPFIKQIPFISDYFKPKVSDPTGSLKIDTLDVNSKFLLNVKEGKLFVITGRVKNGYPDVRRFIKINGKLYKKGKVLYQTETAFCGNVLSDIELSNMDLETIKKRLSNRAGDNKSNMMVKPGGELPFMIIFSNLPVDLEEFSIEVASSTLAGAAG